MNNHRDPNSNDEPTPRKSVDEFVQEHLTPERLNNIWDRLQGVGTRDGRPSTSYGWSNFLADLWETSRVTRLLHKLAAAGALAGAAVIILMLAMPSQLVVHTPAPWQGASAFRLPDTLRFQLGKSRASLEGKPFALAGRLGGTTRGGSAITSIEASFTGTNQNGERIEFQGALVLTNAPGVINVRGRHDFVGACLKGDLIIGTNAPVPFAQIYLPQ